MEMKRKSIPAIVIIVASLPVLVSMALEAQDRFTLKAPNGVAVSEIRGYETWQDVAPSQTDEGLKIILGNTVIRDDKRVQGRHSRQWQAFSRRLHHCKDRVVQEKEPCVPLFGDGPRHPKIGFVHREEFQEIPGYEWMGICAVFT